MEQREHMELEELREQVSLLKDKLQRQQIISERMIAEATSQPLTDSRSVSSAPKADSRSQGLRSAEP